MEDLFSGKANPKRFKSVDKQALTTLRQAVPPLVSSQMRKTGFAGNSRVMSDEEVSRLVVAQIEPIKRALKEADQSRCGQLALDVIDKLMRRFGIATRYESF
jgi:hypothetical protein